MHKHRLGQLPMVLPNLLLLLQMPLGLSDTTHVCVPGIQARPENRCVG